MVGFLSLDELFDGRHFDREIIVLCVRWDVRFKLSFRDLAEMMAERGLSMADTTIMRSVHHYAPEFERRWNRFARPAGSCGSDLYFDLSYRKRLRSEAAAAKQS
jgi:hypothetical protein